MNQLAIYIKLTKIDIKQIKFKNIYEKFVFK